MNEVPYTKGLHEVGEGVYAYLVPNGSWGLSNAGLVAGEGESLLVDTLFDYGLTRDMLAAMAPVTGDRPITTLINTHGDGDHWWGNALVPEDARIYSTSAAVTDMNEFPPAAVAAMLAAELPAEVKEFIETSFGTFDFTGIEPRLPDETVDAPRTFSVGGREVEFIPLGPAHTDGDAVVHVPDARLVFTADILFVGGTPITWHGPISSWIDACDRLLALDVDTYVPGHGPVTDADGVRDVQRYFEFVLEQSRERHAAGMAARKAADDIELGAFAELTDADRIVANVDRAYAELDPAYEGLPRPVLFGEMTKYRRDHGLSPHTT